MHVTDPVYYPAMDGQDISGELCYSTFSGGLFFELLYPLNRISIYRNSSSFVWEMTLSRNLRFVIQSDEQIRRCCATLLR
jgi:hypothetical protein